MSLEFCTFIDANQMNSATLANLIDNTWKPNYHTLIVATNGGINQLNANLTVCDSRGVGYIGNDFNRINPYLYNTTTWQPLTDAGTQAEANTIVQAIVAEGGAHPSLRAWYLADEPRGVSNARLQKLRIAFNTYDPTRPVTAMLIGLNADRGGIQAPLVGLQSIMMDVYSIGRQAAPMNFAMTPFGLGSETFPSYVRTFLGNASYDPQAMPLLMLLQAHDVLIDGNPAIYSTRLPSVAETYAQLFMAVGEGADTIGFFAWQARAPDVNGNNGWTGIENMPAQWAAMVAFAGRVQPFKSLLSSTGRAAVQAFTAGAAYCSTLINNAGRTLLVVCNTTPAAADFTLSGSGAQASGYLRNLETNAVIAVGSTIHLASGEGRFYEWSTSASAQPPGHNGVPMLTVSDYFQTVEEYWDAHPFNPESPNYNPTINIPPGALEIDVNAAPHNGNLWSAVQAAHAAVGLDGHAVLWLGNGNYDATTVLPPGFTGRAKNNIQFRAKAGATPVFLGRLRLIPFEDARDYDWWSDAQQHRWTLTLDDPLTPSRKLTAREPISRGYLLKGWYFKGITFDGQGTQFDSVYLSTARDVIFDDCVFQGHIHPGGTVHPAPLSGNAVLRNIWVRNCLFRGRLPYTVGNLPWQGVYLDGLHAGGAINCTFENSFASHTEILILANNDFLRDYNGNGVADIAEWPMGQYNVSYNCLSRSTFKHFDVTGRNNMVVRLTKTGGAYGWSAAWFDSKEDTIVNSEFSKVQYRFTGNVVKLCDISAITASGYLVRTNSKLPGAATPPAPLPLIGLTTVKDNIVRVGGWTRWLSQEGPIDQHLTPNVVTGNATSGTIPPPATGGGTGGAGTTSSLVFATQPSNGTANQPLATVVVEARDATGALATAYNDTVTLSLAVNPSGGSLAGALTVNAVNGVATFSGLSVSDAGIGYRLRAVSAVDVSAQSTAFDVALPSPVGSYRPGTLSVAAVGSVPAPTTISHATIARPVGVLDTDTAIAVLYREAQADPTGVPAGFSLVGAANFGTSFRAWVYAGPAGAATSYVWQWAAAAWRQASILFVRGQDAVTALDVAGTFATNDANGTQVTAPGITTVTDYALVVGAWTIRSGGTIWTPPVGYTARTPAQAHVFLATTEQHPPGATGDQIATVNLSGPRAAMMVAVRPAATLAPPPQYARPVSDGSAGGWSAVPIGGSLASKIDDDPLNDLDFIVSPPGPNGTSVFRVKLGTVNPPASTSGHRLSVRARKDQSGGQRIDLVLRLVQGASTIRTWTINDLTDVMTTYVLGDLTTAEAAAITNYADLWLEGYALGAGS